MTRTRPPTGLTIYPQKRFSTIAVRPPEIFSSQFCFEPLSARIAEKDADDSDYSYYSYNSNNRLTSFNGSNVTLTYDENMNMTKMSLFANRADIGRGATRVLCGCMGFPGRLGRLPA